ncbi:LytTR family DNA-binding domain-containing protein [Carboxylicivirga sp. RSCT41]|uniref:LytTR family DNA-binding domain-containing protein n=1 Tax=Carboxylicivirga agarovorans TaxID=3417570 RepID=UPI003D3586BE
MKYLLIENNLSIRRIDIAGIQCIIFRDGQLAVQMIDGEKLLHCATLNELHNQLPDTFVKVNRNVIINIDCVVSIQKQLRIVTLYNGQEFSVSRRKMSVLITTFSQFLKDINRNVE